MNEHKKTFLKTLQQEHKDYLKVKCFLIQMFLHHSLLQSEYIHIQQGRNNDHMHDKWSKFSLKNLNLRQAPFLLQANLCTDFCRSLFYSVCRLSHFLHKFCIRFDTISLKYHCQWKHQNRHYQYIQKDFYYYYWFEYLLILIQLFFLVFMLIKVFFWIFFWNFTTLNHCQ